MSEVSVMDGIKVKDLLTLEKDKRYLIRLGGDVYPSDIKNIKNILCNMGLKGGNLVIIATDKFNIVELE